MAILLTGCVSLVPQNNDVPAIDLPASFEQIKTEEVFDASQISWRDYFNDPALIKLIDIALTNNNDLKLAMLNVEEAYKQYGVTQSDRYPQLDTISSITYSGKNRTESNKNYQLSATLSFELDLFGRLKNLSEAQLARYLATKEAQRNTFMLLVAQVAQTYLTERVIIAKISVVDKQINNYQQSLSFIKARIISGESTYLEFEQAKGILENAYNSRIELQQQQQITHHTLQNLLNRYDLAIDPKLDLVVSSVIIPANLPSSTLLKRPDVIQAEYQLTATNADIGVARAAFFPSISLTGNVGNSSTELSDLLSGATLWSFVPKITLPLFNGEKNQFNLALANIRYQQSVIEYEKTIHAAFKEVADLLTLQQNYQQQLIQQQRYLVTQENVLSLAKQGYMNGSSSYLDILDAQRNVLSTELTLLTLTQNKLINEVNLFIALGGGGQA